MLNFYSYNLKKNITIKEYLNTDTILDQKKIFEQNMIDFDSSIFLYNFKKIDKNTFLKDLNNNIIILDSKKIQSKPIIQENNNSNNCDTTETVKYLNLFSKYKDLILFTFIITKNSYKETLYFLEKYNLKYKQIFNIIKNNQNELIEMIESDPNLLTNILKKYKISSNPFFINTFSNISPHQSIISEIEELFPDVPTENINELISVFTNNVLII